MVFVSKNIFRKCKWCDKETKKNLSSGRHKGYYRTCGSEECLRRQYDDLYVCIKKGKPKNKVHGICDICEKKFDRICPSHKKYCLECVPDGSWRARAQRYRIGKPQWEKMLENQNNTCALCEKNPEVIDHCHETGKIRGLLCQGCNLAIGTIENMKNKFQKLFEYLGIKNAI